jgi:ribulose-phosphate 3-epimerase
MAAEIYPAILAHTFEEYTTRLDLIETSEANWVHVDIMDGQFVPNITVMPHEIATVATRLNIEAHLMTATPERYFSDLSVLNCGRVLLHREAYESLEACAAAVKQALDYLPEVGIVFNPETPFEDCNGLGVTSIQCMGVHPGQSGQPLIEGTYERVKQCKELHPKLIIAVDGGVDERDIQPLRKAGADRFVIASHLFVSNQVPQNFSYFTQLLTGGA